MASQAHSFPSTSSYSLCQEPILSLVVILRRLIVAGQLLLSIGVVCTILASRPSCHCVSLATLLPLSRISIRFDRLHINSISSKLDSSKLSSNHGSHYSSARRQRHPRAHPSWDCLHHNHHSLHCSHHLRLVSPLVSSWHDSNQDPRLPHHSISCIEHSCLRCSSLHRLPIEWTVQVSELFGKESVFKLDLPAPQIRN